jgi:signal transduction histidine kinase
VPPRRADGTPLPAGEQPLHRVLVRGEEVRGEELSIPCADGSWATVRVHAAPLWNPGRRGVSALVVVDDITEVRAAQLEREQGARFAEQFVGILGHDLRNPLSAIQMATLLLGRSALSDPQSRSVRRIQGSADRMRRMVTQLLDLTRSRLGGGIPVSRRLTDLCEVVRQAVDELALGHPDRILVCRAEGRLLGAFDPDRLAQVVSNLVGNALQHGRRDEPVDVVVTAEAEAAVVVVHNTGPAIPPEHLPTLFEPYRRGERSREPSPGGLGLGLFISEQIVLAHGGTIAVRSTPEEGTTFTVRLPRRAAETAAARPPRPAPDEPAHA